MKASEQNNRLSIIGNSRSHASTRIAAASSSSRDNDAIDYIQDR